MKTRITLLTLLLITCCIACLVTAGPFMPQAEDESPPMAVLELATSPQLPEMSIELPAESCATDQSVDLDQILREPTFKVAVNPECLVGCRMEMEGCIDACEAASNPPSQACLNACNITLMRCKLDCWVPPI